MKTEEEIKDKAEYLFKNALIYYFRAQGFKSPKTSADSTIYEFLSFIK